MTAASPGPAPVTPGQAAHAAYIAHLRPGAPETADYEGAWEAAAQAATARHVLSGTGALMGDIVALQAERDGLKADVLEFGVQLGTAQRERDEARADWANLSEQMAAWPKCPDGCGCRLGTDDADARECACDGPCCDECRENGYPDAPSYRDLAVRCSMADRDEVRAVAAEAITALERLMSETPFELCPDIDTARWRQRAGLEDS